SGAYPLQSTLFHIQSDFDISAYNQQYNYEQTASPAQLRSKKTSTKPYQCKLCLKAFRELRNYKYHMNIHTGETPYACDICNKAFKNPGNLRQHKLKHLNKQDSVI
ncbi:unnamed protein product, partial [Owenia fusiformis]